MYNHESITITQIANGFLVTFPYIAKAYDPEMEARRMVRIGIEEQERDPILSDLQEPQYVPPKPPELKDIKNDCIHFCKDIPAALELISEKMK